MPLHLSKDGYVFKADTDGLTIRPGPRPVCLSRSELENLGLAVRDDFQVPFASDGERCSLIGAILGTLSQALKKLEGPRHRLDRQNIRRAMVLLGGLDEKSAQSILDQEGV